MDGFIDACTQAHKVLISDDKPLLKLAFEDLEDARLLAKVLQTVPPTRRS